MAEVRVSGLQELGAALDLLPKKVEQSYIRTASKKGAEVIRAEVETLAPKDSGEMAAAVTVKTMIGRRAGMFLALIGVRYKAKAALTSRRPGRTPTTEDPGVYAQFVEFGRPGKRGHTHQEAHPFMGPSFKAKAEEAIKTVADSLKQQLGDLIR